MRALEGADQARLAQLVGTLNHCRQTLRYVDYSQAEKDCERLAARLRAVLSPQQICQMSFKAIPRGGMIVLGMLSYMLDLRPEQLSDDDSEQPLVVVDDCALTGARCFDFLSRTREREILFAHLYSHPDLRQSILERESRVNLCLAARNLKDHGRAFFPEPADYESWQARWQRRLGPGRYWYGLPDLVCFAWSEPDRLFWNLATETVEGGWRFLPPHRCLKNRAALGGPEMDSPVVEWRVSEKVVSGEFDGSIWLCHTGTGRVYSLDGVSAAMWRPLAGWGNRDLAVAELVTAHEVDENTVRRDLEKLLAQLAEAGLLEPVGPDGSRAGRSEPTFGEVEGIPLGEPVQVESGETPGRRLG